MDLDGLSPSEAVNKLEGSKFVEAHELAPQKSAFQTGSS
jgi:hypothetical protein